MIILDTNVISELMRPAPERAVIEWFGTHAISAMATTAINIAEIRHGLARLPNGRRRDDLESRFRSLAARGFQTRIFDFDAAAAEIFGELAAGRGRAGIPLRGFDGLVAAIAKSNATPIATRNVQDFAGCGIELINPWETPRSRD